MIATEEIPAVPDYARWVAEEAKKSKVVPVVVAEKEERANRQNEIRANDQGCAPGTEIEDEVTAERSEDCAVGGTWERGNEPDCLPGTEADGTVSETQSGPDQTGGAIAMIKRKESEVQTSYDLVADLYAQRIHGELEHKPFDRQLLNRFAERVKAIGPAYDIGCGPGQVARYLDEQGVQTIGIDLSPAMVEHARSLNPGIEFRQGDMRALEIEDESTGGIVAFYSIIHISQADVVSVLLEMKRILRPGGLLLLAFHIGDRILHMDEWWGRQVSVDFIFYPTEEMKGFLDSAGLLVGEVVEREPYPDIEHQSRRAYILAEKRQESG